MTSLTNIGSPNIDPGPVVEVDAGSQSEAWRGEVAARLARYRTRRKPRAPRYPSLLLPFDSAEYRSQPPAAVASTSATSPADDNFPDFETQDSTDTAEVGFFPLNSAGHQPAPPDVEADLSARVRETKMIETKILEFPRSAAIPVIHVSTLADPIFDRPRIVEAPEVLPPPPALGGMLIEPAEPPADPRAGVASRLQSVSIPRRLLATAVDGLIVIAGLSVFAAIFQRFNPIRGPLPLLAGMTAAIAVLLWMAYQFVFVVYTGSTPGFRAARITLASFDGSPVNRRSRRWRVLASFLSAFSAGLGYLWCFLDADSLCWHDRITRTHLRSAR